MYFTPDVFECRKLGLLQGVPTVHDPEDTLSGARRRAERVAKSKTIKNQKELACNWGTRSIDEMTRNLTDPLKLYVSRFPPPARLHPFESELLDLSIGVQRYATAVQNVNSLRKSISATGKEAMARAARASSKNDALSLREQGFETLASAWRKGSKSVTSLKEVAKVRAE